MPNELADSIAATLATARRERSLSANALAERSGVSRAMIGKIERGEAQPTAVLLSRLAAALGLSLSELVTRAEGGARPQLARAADQPVWTDPGSGYTRRLVSPGAGGALELIEVDLPPGARVTYPAASYAGTEHQIWVRAGRLDFHEGETVHRLRAGDCLRLGPPASGAYHNPTGRPCRYVVALVRLGRGASG